MCSTAGVSLLNPSLGHNRARAGRLERPPRLLRPKYRLDLSLGEALPSKDGDRPPQLASKATDKNPIDGPHFCPEVLDVGLARISAPHHLPIRNDHRGLLHDRPRPRQLLGTSRIETTGDEVDPAAFDLLDGHPAILGLFPILVGELDEVNEVGVLETDSIAPAIEDLRLAEIEPIPPVEVHQRREGQKTGRVGDHRVFFCHSPIIGDALYPRQVLPAPRRRPQRGLCPVSANATGTFSQARSMTNASSSTRYKAYVCAEGVWGAAMSRCL
jgi:hypothetical protein